MGKTIFYIVLGIVVIWFIYSRFSPVTGLQELHASDFQKELLDSKNMILIDVREKAEVQQGFIAGAVHIPLGQLANRLNEVPKDKKVMLYCRSGSRSRQAAKVLLDNGYEQVTHLQGGILAWTGALKK